MPLNLSVTHAAASLGVSLNNLSAILNGRAGISPEMAIRLSIAFNTTAESWLRQQMQHDLSRAGESRKRLRQVVTPFPGLLLLGPLSALFRSSRAD